MGENGNNGNLLRFGDFELDLAKRRLMHDGQSVSLKPKAFDLLAVLVQNNGRLLSKDELFRLVWGEQIVEETNLSVGISAIRRALGETATEPRYITNVSGRGYYFDADLKNGYDSTVSKAAIAGNGNGPSPIIKPAPTAITRSRWPALLVSIAAIFGTAFSGYYFLGDSRKSSVPEALSVKRLTTTGRALNVAASPDGKMFAFAQVEPDGKTSLWLSQIDGSGQIQLRAPSEKLIGSTYYTPDGNRIFFVQFDSNVGRRGSLYRIPVIGGVPEKVLDGVASRIAISPDGREAAFYRNLSERRSSAIIVAALDGSGEHELAVRADDQGAFSPMIDWSPDGSQLAVGVHVSNKSPGPIEIFLLSPTDGNIRQVTNEGWAAITSIVWTRDSNGVIASVGDKSSDMERQIWYIPTVGKPQRLLADSNSYGSISNSKDGSALIAIQGQSLSNVWVSPANDLAKAKQLTFDMIGKQSGWNSIDWTTDGQIIYSGRIGKSDTIWQMTADGADQRPLLSEIGRNEYASLPDDGKFVVFVSNRTGQSEIWRANRDGTELRALTSSGDNEASHVSPNGKWIVYNNGRQSERRLWRIPADGGEPVRLTDAPSDWARFSPDSLQIASAYEINGRAKLAVLNAGGGEPLATFDIPETANFRLGVRWTPDGKAVTYRDWQNGIWKQSLDGGPPVRLAGLPSEKLFAYAWSRDGQWFAYSRGTALSDAVLLTNLK